MRLAYFVSPAKRPVGRLVNWGQEIRDGRIYYAFTIPSEHKTNGNYELLVDCVTLETSCDCEWHRGKRGTRAGLATYGPVDLLHPNALCWHLRAVSRWIKRYKKAVRAARPHAIEVNRILMEQARESA